MGASGRDCDRATSRLGGRIALSTSALAIVAIAALISLGLWLSMAAARFARMEVLPAHSRRRVQWWQANTAHIQVACVLVALVAACLQLSGAG